MGRSCDNKSFRATGNLFPDGTWKWEPVTWTKCWCGLFHSNRHIPDKFWDRTWEKNKGPKLSGGVMLFRELKNGRRQFFMVQSYGNLFGFPKGSLEPNENYFDGAMREFYEETGTKLDIPKKNCLEVRKVIGDNRVSIFVAKVPSDFEIKTKPKSDVEISSYGFIDEYNLRYYKINRITRDTLEIIKKAKHKL